MRLIPKGWGEYPPEYNREIHGPYNPSVYYGKPDTPFGEVKIKDLPSWFARRNKTPRAVAQAISRAWFKHQINWVQTNKPSAAWLYQSIAIIVLINYVDSYGRIRNERLYRYH